MKRFYLEPDYSAGHNCYRVIDTQAYEGDYPVAKGLTLHHAVRAVVQFEECFNVEGKAKL